MNKLDVYFARWNAWKALDYTCLWVNYWDEESDFEGELHILSFLTAFVD